MGYNLPRTPEGVELAMYYDEAVQWIEALEWWIKEQGLQVPTWAAIESAGWAKRTHPEGPARHQE